VTGERDENGNTVLTISPDEAHVLIWGGPVDVCGVLDQLLRTTLLDIEDHQMTGTEYQERFGDLSAMYERLRVESSKVSPQ
jgi:hypothetical protein